MKETQLVLQSFTDPLAEICHPLLSKQEKGCGAAAAGRAGRRSKMGGGNGQKAKTARERNMEKNKPAKGSQLETNKKAMNIQCKVDLTKAKAKELLKKVFKEMDKAKDPKIDAENRIVTNRSI